jgi:hypothetical protein
MCPSANVIGSWQRTISERSVRETVDVFLEVSRSEDSRS